MANTNKKGLVYYLRRISEALTSFGQSRDDDEKVVAYALNDLNARMEAVEARPVPQTHVLEVLDSLNNGTLQEALALFKLDGDTPTLDDIMKINMTNTCVLYADLYFQISTLYVYSGGIGIIAGYLDRDQDNKISIDLTDSTGSITIEQN